MEENNYCGCTDGLVEWAREIVLVIIKDKSSWLPTFYVINEQGKDDFEKLYTLCGCGAAVGSDEIRSPTAMEIAEWLLEDECNCVSDQTCGVCRLAEDITRR